MAPTSTSYFRHIPSSLATVIVLLLCLTATTQATFYSFAPKDDPQNPCILLDLNFTVVLKAFDENKKTIGQHEITQWDTVKVGGSCDNTPQLFLRFENSTITWSFVFKKDGDLAVLDRLLQFVPSKVFGGEVPWTVPVVFDDPGTTQIGGQNTSFRCHTSKTTTYGQTQPSGNYTFDVTTFVDAIQTQAFDVQGGKFSPATECPEDQTTTTSRTTTTAILTSATSANSTDSTTLEPVTNTTTLEPVTNTTTLQPVTNTTTLQPTTNSTTTETTNSSTSQTVTNSTTPGVTNSTQTSPTASTTPAGPPVNNYTVSDGNKVCIVLVASINIQIEYEVENRTTDMLLAEVEIPTEYGVTGSCGKDANATTQSVSIKFDKGWSLQFTFTSTDGLRQNEVNTTGKSYRISHLSLDYVIDEEHFPFSVIPMGTTVSTSSSSSDFPSKSSSKAGYYKCDRLVTLGLGPNARLQTHQLRFKAFGTDDSAEFEGKAYECSADDDSNDVVPILVGTLIGGVLLIVIVLFFLNRWKKSRRSYHTI